MSTAGIIYLVLASLVFLAFAAWMQYKNKKLAAENALLWMERKSLLKNGTPMRDKQGRFIKPV